jgi:hypothetical protein
VEWNTNDSYPSTVHITAWGDVSVQLQVAEAPLFQRACLSFP